MNAPSARVCVFDVNETLLDMAALDPLFERVFGDAAVRGLWFAQMLQSALVSTVTGAYTNFGETGLAALEMLAGRRGVELTDADRAGVADGMKQLPAHPEARASLERLREAGVRMATLTNSTQGVADAQLIHAGLSDLFEQRLSADDVKRLKPAPEPYRMAAERLGVPTDRIRLVAAHAWDVRGALSAGCAAAFVARPGMLLDPLGPEPDVVGADLDAVASAILERERLA